jgi:protein phosphatase methylesterase 1
VWPQGRFQLVLVPRAGHALHEDEPEATAAALAAFVRRNTPAPPPPSGAA